MYVYVYLPIKTTSPCLRGGSVATLTLPFINVILRIYVLVRILTLS